MDKLGSMCCKYSLQLRSEAKGDGRSALIFRFIGLAMPPVVEGDAGIASPMIPKPPAITVPGCGVYSAAELVAVVAVTAGETKKNSNLYAIMASFRAVKG